MDFFKEFLLNGGFGHGVSRARDHVKVGFGPSAVEFPCREGGADHIVTALDDACGDMSDLVDVFEQPVVRFKKATVDKVVTFDAGKSECFLVVFKATEVIGGDIEAAGTDFPMRPCSGCMDLDVDIFVGESSIIGFDQAVSFFEGDGFEKIFPVVGEDGACATFIKPVEFLGAQQEDPAQDQAKASVGVGDGVGEGEGGAPASAKDEPLLDVEMASDGFDIVDEMPCGVFAQFGVGLAVSTAALIKEDDAETFGVKETSADR